MMLRALLRGKAPESGVFWAVVHDWWAGLEKDRGARARLRRAKKPVEVFISPDFQRGLVNRLAEKNIRLSPKEQEKLALGIGVLVHVKPPVDGQPAPFRHFARQLAPGDDPRKCPSVRDPRFRKLLAIDDNQPDALFLMLRRLAVYLERNLDPIQDRALGWQSLVKGASDWTDQTRRDWAEQYYVNLAVKK